MVDMWPSGGFLLYKDYPEPELKKTEKNSDINFKQRES